MSIWFTSDTHFGHANILTFKDGEGMHIREGFASVEEMDETIIARWNECVRPGDKIYHLGDVLFGDRRRLVPIMSRLHGAKRLLVGNHDDIKAIVEAGVFQKIGLWRMFTDHGFVCSHIPLPPDQFRFKVRLNVHGHIHEKPDPSPLHMNISVERTNYRPVHIDEIVARVKQLKESHDDKASDVR